MTDLYDLKDLPRRTGSPEQDFLWALLRLAGEPDGIPRWARLRVTSGRQVQLTPHDRGAAETNIPYELDLRVLARGISRIVLRPGWEVPPGVALSTRDLLAVALETRNLTGLQPVDADAAAQCGLFGEVIYR